MPSSANPLLAELLSAQRQAEQDHANGAKVSYAYSDAPRINSALTVLRQCLDSAKTTWPAPGGEFEVEE